MEWDGRAVPHNLFQPPLIGSWVGRTGSGKSTQLINMLMEYQKANTFDKWILISPSAKDDPKYNYLKWDEIYENYSDDVLKKIVQEQDDDMAEYKEYLETLDLYKRLIKAKSIDEFTKEEKKKIYKLLLTTDGIIRKPESTYGRSPQCCVVMDDLGSSSAYSNATRNYLNAISSRCRHKQISMFHCVQHLYQLSRCLRQQCSVMSLFRTKDYKLLKEIASENSSCCTQDEFISLFEKATQDNKHDSLVCDFQNDNFRKNYDTLLLI